MILRNSNFPQSSWRAWRLTFTSLTLCGPQNEKQDFQAAIRPGALRVRSKAPDQDSRPFYIEYSSSGLADYTQMHLKNQLFSYSGVQNFCFETSSSTKYPFSNNFKCIPGYPESGLSLSSFLISELEIPCSPP